MATKKTSIDFTIGLPPANLRGDTNTVLRNSMPLVRIYPGVPSFTKGISLFTRRDLFSSGGKNSKELSYTTLLSQHGFTLQQTSATSNGYLELAFLADSFPTDSFTNEYGENFLQSFTDVASEKSAAIMQMMGASSAGQAFDKLTKGLKTRGGAIGKTIGTALSAGRNAAADLVKALPGGGTLAGGINLVSSLAAGSRLDFPMLWKSSGFQPSYTMTIRLYNPNPSDADTTRKYIIGPIAALMLLGIPISHDGVTYSWPFIHKIYSPGIYNLDPAFISNITVIKGGDQQQISFKQKLGIVDVRIDFGSLFNSILAGRNSSNRPTLQNYIDGMSNEKSGVRNFSTYQATSAQAQEHAAAARIANTTTITTKRQAPTAIEKTDEEKQNPAERVASSVKAIADAIEAKMPSAFKI